MHTLKLRAVGTSTGTVIPKEMLARLKVAQGDQLYAVETPDGYLLTPYDPEFHRQLSLAEEIMREDRDVLKALSK